MITVKKIELYRKYKGNADMFQMAALPWQRNKIPQEDWTMISQLVQDLKLVNRGLASDSYKEDVLNKIKSSCEDEETAEELKKMAREM
jgi:hypothetical protein